MIWLEILLEQNNRYARFKTHCNAMILNYIVKQKTDDCIIQYSYEIDKSKYLGIYLIYGIMGWKLVVN